MQSLSDWRKKTSWKLTYPFCPVYLSRRNGTTDIDLRAMLRQEKTLTLDESHPTGLAEFDFVPAEFPRERLDQDIIVPDTPAEAAKGLLALMREYITQTWNPKVFHLVWMSGGRDSRILAWVLKGLSREMDLGEYLFACHEPEQDYFTRAMEEIGFENFVVFKDNALASPDYYEVYPLATHNVNAWVGPYPKHVPHHINPAKTAVISGSFGGEQTDYPTHRGLNYINFGLLTSFAPWPSLTLLEEYAMWADILMPYASYAYMNYMNHLPAKFFPSRTPGEGGDLLRDAMLAEFGNRTDFFYGHQYNHKISPALASRVNREYIESKFVARFKTTNPIVTSFKPGDAIYTRSDRAAKYFGLASVFEGL